MTQDATPFTRRRLIGASLAAGGLVVAQASPALAALGVATPPQTMGPFFPREKPLDVDNDLTRIGAGGLASGTPIHVIGRVVDKGGRPVAGAVVEIWQADAIGRYHYVNDGRDVPMDVNFQGYGHDTTDDEGAYRFLTIQPPPYPASASWMRPAHIHFRISGPGFERLATQLYFLGDPHLATDRVFNAIRDPAQRASVVVSVEAPAAGLEPAAGVCRFEIVLGNPA